MLADILHDVVCEIAVVDDMNLFERIEEVAWQHVAEAVLEDDESAVVLGGCTHYGETLVATHHGAIGASVAVFVFVEERSFLWTAFADDAVVLVEGVVDVCGGVFHIGGDVVDEVLGCVLQRDIFRVAVHAAYVAMYHVLLVGLEVAEGYSGYFGEGLCGIEPSEWCPMVVGTQEDIFVLMFLEDEVDVHRFDARIEVCEDVADGGQLGVGVALHFLRTIVGDGGRDDHTVDVDVGEGRFVVISHIGIVGTTCSRPSECHQGAYVLILTHNHDTCIRYLGILLEGVFIGLAMVVSILVYRVLSLPLGA